MTRMDFPLFRATALAATLCLNAAPQFAHAAPPAVRAETPVTLNFVNADIEAVSRAMGSMLGRSLIVDPRVKGTVTLYSEQPMRAQEAFAQYLAALRGLGFSVIDAAGLLKVVPEADAKLQATTVVLDDSKIRGDQIITQVFQLKHENANNLVAVLRPLVNVNNTINANPGNNSLVITDYADNLKRIAKIIAALDTGAATDVEVLVLQHAVANDVAALLQKLGEGGSGAAAPQGGGGPATTQVVAEPRNNSLILRAPNPARLAALKALAQKLDRPASNAAGGIHVVHLKNADASKLAQVLRAAFANSGNSNSGSGGLAGFAQSASPTPQQPQSISAQPGGGGNSGANSAAAATPVAASAQPSTGGFIQADPATNSLIITAADPLYRQMRAVIDQLDGRRAQIYVETMIVKVDASRGAQFGVQWQNLFGDKGDRSIGGAGTNFGTDGANIINLSAAAAKGRAGAKDVLGSVPAGLNLGFLKKIGDFYTLGALANFLESETGVNILSTPNLVALDNEEAKIVVGQNVPFVTGSFTNTGAGAGAGGAVNPFQTVERKDVGLVLRVKAQIGEGGSIRMVIYHENSSVVPGGSQSTGPITDKNAIETTVTVDDGGLLVLGGLIKDEYVDGNDGVPGLSKIPLIGHLFKSENRKRQRTNLMVFLRPTVLRTAEDADRMTLNRYDQIRAFQDKAQPASSLLLPDTGAPQLPARGAPGQAGPKAD